MSVATAPSSERRTRYSLIDYKGYFIHSKFLCWTLQEYYLIIKEASLFFYLSEAHYLEGKLLFFFNLIDTQVIACHQYLYFFQQKEDGDQRRKRELKGEKGENMEKGEKRMRLRLWHEREEEVHKFLQVWKMCRQGLDVKQIYCSKFNEIDERINQQITTQTNP